MGTVKFIRDTSATRQWHNMASAQAKAWADESERGKCVRGPWKVSELALKMTSRMSQPFAPISVIMDCMKLLT